MREEVAMLPSGWMICELCERMAPRNAITKHHLNPRSRPKRIGRAGVAVVCVPCHLAIHQTFSNKELGARFYTIQRIRESGRLRVYLGGRRQEVGAETEGKEAAGMK